MQVVQSVCTIHMMMLLVGKYSITLLELVITAYIITVTCLSFRLSMIEPITRLDT